MAGKPGATAAAQAAPDGYVLHLTSNGTAISTALFRQLPYDVLRDFTPITITAWFDLIIATKSDGPLQTVADILKAARQSPGKHEQRCLEGKLAHRSSLTHLGRRRPVAAGGQLLPGAGAPYA